jgi:NAD(P)-dependent dehydrogenase (short-subunit alcohol dehydrogenase family)
MSDLFTLDGKVALVTGSSRGLGFAMAEALAAHGALVVLNGRDPTTLADRVGELEGRGLRAEAKAFDVTSSEAIRAALDEIKERHGRLDVLVNNAGGAPFADAATASPRFSAAIIALNLTAPLQFAQRANQQMQSQATGGVIINIASVSGTRPSPGTAAYGAAKAGLLNLTQSLAVEWAPKVRVAAVTAGMIRTESAHLHYGSEAGIAAVAATVPLGRLGLPEDVGNACVFLASPMASYLSGSSIVVHGGGERPAFLDAARDQ